MIIFWYYKKKKTEIKLNAPIFIKASLNIDLSKNEINIFSNYNDFFNKSRTLELNLKIAELFSKPDYFQIKNDELVSLLKSINDKTIDLNDIDIKINTLESQSVDFFWKTEIGKSFWFSVFLSEYDKEEKIIKGIASTTIYPKNNKKNLFKNSFESFKNYKDYDLSKKINYDLKNFPESSYSLIRLTLNEQTRLLSLESTGLFQLLTAFGSYLKSLDFLAYLSSYATIIIVFPIHSNSMMKNKKDWEMTFLNMFYEFANENNIFGEDFMISKTTLSNDKTISGISNSLFETRIRTIYESKNIQDITEEKLLEDLKVTENEILKSIKNKGLEIISNSIETKENLKYKHHYLNLPFTKEETLPFLKSSSRKRIFDYLISNVIDSAKKNTNFIHYIVINVSNIPELTEIKSLPKNMRILFSALPSDKYLYYDEIRHLSKIKDSKIEKNIGILVSSDSTIYYQLLSLINIKTVLFPNEFIQKAKYDDEYEIMKGIMETKQHMNKLKKDEHEKIVIGNLI